MSIAAAFEGDAFEPSAFQMDAPRPTASYYRTHQRPQQRATLVDITGVVTLGTFGISARVGVVPDEDWLLDFGTPY